MFFPVLVSDRSAKGPILDPFFVVIQVFGLFFFLMKGLDFRLKFRPGKFSRIRVT